MKVSTVFATSRGCLEEEKKRHSRVLTLNLRRRNEAEDSLTLPESQRLALRSASCPFAGGNQNGSHESELMPGSPRPGESSQAARHPGACWILMNAPEEGRESPRTSAPSLPRKFREDEHASRRRSRWQRRRDAPTRGSSSSQESLVSRASAGSWSVSSCPRSTSETGRPRSIKPPSLVARPLFFCFACVRTRER